MRLLRPLALLVGLLGSSALAQPLLRGESPTDNVYNPTIGLSGLGDASSIVANPAMLSTLRSWSLVYLHTERPSQGLAGGRGDGFYFATPVPLLRALTFGLSLQSVRPPSTFPYRSTVKITEALSYRICTGLSLALSYSYVSREAPDHTRASTHTLDLGLSLRLNRFLAGGLVMRDVNAPMVYGVPTQRVYDFEAVWRPWGNERLELGLGSRIGERRRDVDPHFRVWLSPVQGFHVKADVQWRRDVDLDGRNDNDVRAALGLELDLDRFSVGGYGLFGRELDQNKGEGFTLVARVHGERALPPWQTLPHLEKIVLDGETTGKALVALHRRLREIETERLTAGVVVQLGALPLGWGATEGLRGSLQRLRDRGKRVYVTLMHPSTRGYYLASVGDKLFLHPGGGVALSGLHSTVTYFGGTGELLGVKADFVRIGAYKSAPEQFTSKEGSAAAREQRNAYLDDVFESVLQAISKSRQVDVATVRRWIDGGPYTAASARRLGLVDELATESQLGDAITHAFGKRVAVRPWDRGVRRQTAFVPSRVAVLAIDGDLVEGESLTIPLLNKKLTGAKTIAKLLDEVRTTSAIRGLVVYLDTPGGSALASELLHDKLKLVAKTKPVVCVMGDVAASGGYFIASACEKIIASPSTLTGSIGIFTGKFDISGLAAKLGVGHESFERGKSAGVDSLWRGYTEEERAQLADQLRYYYDRFVDAVAEGRALDRAAVDKVGQGHIWSGRAALRHHLVDELGGIGEGLDWILGETGYRAGELELTYLPEERPMLFALLGLLGIDLKAQSDASFGVPFLSQILSRLPGSLLRERSTPQARLDMTMTID